MSRSISVAFSNMVSDGWLAGGQYLYNLFFAIKHSGVPVEVVLKVLPDTNPQTYAMLEGLFNRVLEVPPPLPRWMQKIPGIVRKRLAKIYLEEEQHLAKNQVDVQFTVLNLACPNQIPILSWIPDFQYLHFPDFFSKEELSSRINNYLDSAYRSTRVILSSNNALEDLTRVASSAVGKARILNFASQIDPEVYEADPRLIARYYHLPEKFFFLPNQFWQHKNHELVIKALILAKVEMPEITVVCSGGIYDHRKPQFFDLILQQIAVNGLQNNFRILGRIPRSHFWQLMRGAVVVLQPSLFEGWSTSIEEAKSLGKSVLVSDIPVHREQNPPSAIYFDPRNPAELAQSLLKIQSGKMPGPELDLEQFARSQIEARTHAFARTFYEIVNEVA